MLLEQVAFLKEFRIRQALGNRCGRTVQPTSPGLLLAALDWEWEISGLKRGEFIDLGYHSCLGVQFLARTPGASHFS